MSTGISIADAFEQTPSGKRQRTPLPICTAIKSVTSRDRESWDGRNRLTSAARHLWLCFLTATVFLVLPAHAQHLILVNENLAKASGNLTINSSFEINTGTEATPDTEFTFAGKTYKGRTVQQAGGP